MELEVRTALVDTGMRRLTELVESRHLPPEAAEPYRQQLLHHRRELERSIQERNNQGLKHLVRRDLDIYQEIIEAERKKLLLLHRQREINDQALHLIEHDLDLQEVRLQQHRPSDRT